MKKLFFALITLLAGTITAFADDYAELYQGLPIQLEQASQPTIANSRTNIMDYGAVGDGQTLCTEAIQKAIDELAKKGGGHVDVPAGIWLSAPFKLKSGIDLHLAKNAVLQQTEDRSLCLRQGQSKADPFISCSGAHDVSITGQGIIDGNGKYWRGVKKGKQSDTEWKEYLALGGTVSADGGVWYPFNLKHQGNIAPTMEKQEKMRMNLIRFSGCDRIMVKGITIQNSPKFHLSPYDCRDVIIDGVMVRCPWNAQNGDAIDIGTCQKVLITNCTVDAGDDGICMKGGIGDSSIGHKPCQDILICNNTVFHAHGGFVIGSDCSAGMYKIVVCHNTFSGTDTGLRFKSAIGRGGQTGQIYCYDIMMADIKNEAVVFETTYADKAISGTSGPKKEMKWVPEFNDINIHDITCNGCKTAVSAHGEKGMIHDINISKSTFFYTQKATDIDATSSVNVANDVKMITYNK